MSIITRRSLLGGIIAAVAAPAIVRAQSIMPIVAPKLWVPNDDLMLVPYAIYGGGPVIFEMANCDLRFTGALLVQPEVTLILRNCNIPPAAVIRAPLTKEMAWK